MATELATDTFEAELQELYHVERHLLDLQNGLAEEVSDEDLSALFADHQQETRQQIERLEGVFESFGSDPQERESPIMEGIIAEYEQAQGIDEPDVKDIVDLGIAMGIERFEITTLETLQRLADVQNRPDEIREPLEETRQEAEAALDRMQSTMAG